MYSFAISAPPKKSQNLVENLGRAVEAYFRQGVDQFVIDMSSEIASAIDADALAAEAVSHIARRDFTAIPFATCAVRFSSQLSWQWKHYGNIECAELFAIPFVPKPGVDPDFEGLLASLQRTQDLFCPRSQIRITPNWCSLYELDAVSQRPSLVSAAFKAIYADLHFKKYPVILSSMVDDGTHPRAMIGISRTLVPRMGQIPASILSKSPNRHPYSMDLNLERHSDWRAEAANLSAVAAIGLPVRLTDIALMKESLVKRGEHSWLREVSVN